MDFYEVLGVPHTATHHDISVAYRLAARNLHPDKRPQAEVEHANQDIASLNEAYHTLKDPDRRRLYDLQLSAHGGISPARRITAQHLAWLRFVRFILLGRLGGTVAGCGSPVVELSQANLRRMQLDRKTSFLFLYLPQSERSQKMAAEIRILAKSLQRLFNVFAVNAETEHQLALSLGIESAQMTLPGVLLIRKGRVQVVTPPIVASALVELVENELPKLPRICSRMDLQSTPSKMGVLLSLPHATKRTLLLFRVLCTSEAVTSPVGHHSECAHIPFSKCPIANELAACGRGSIALLAPSPGNEHVNAGLGGARLFGCVEPTADDHEPTDVFDSTLRKQVHRLRSEIQYGHVVGKMTAAAAHTITPIIQSCSRCVFLSALATMNGPACATLFKSESVPLLFGLIAFIWWSATKFVPFLLKPITLVRFIRRKRFYFL